MNYTEITSPYIGKYFKLNHLNNIEYIYIIGSTNNWLYGMSFTDTGTLNENISYSWEILNGKEITKEEFKEHYLQFISNLKNKMNLND